MMGAVLGTLAFVPFVVFEIIKCRRAASGRRGANLWFALGALLLAAGWVLSVKDSAAASWPLFATGLVIAFTGVFCYIFVLRQTSASGNYLRDEAEKVPLVSKGAYAVVRHPGIWCFAAISAGASLMFPDAAAASLWFAFLNLIYTVLQDVYFFPVYIKGYGDYKKEVPFCIPRIWKKV
ncbi:MAG TPA: methyltransferase [Bacillota bacterium]|nr:methyltransferase [Bacillota bacterium]HQC35737.1 methyltransferase [Bacillota bacterium]